MSNGAREQGGARLGQTVTRLYLQNSPDAQHASRIRRHKCGGSLEAEYK